MTRAQVHKQVHFLCQNYSRAPNRSSYGEDKLCIWLLAIKVKSSLYNFLVVRHTALGHLEGFPTFSCIIPWSTPRLMFNFLHLNQIFKWSFVTSCALQYTIPCLILRFMFNFLCLNQISKWRLVTSYTLSYTILSYRGQCPATCILSKP